MSISIPLLSLKYGSIIDELKYYTLWSWYRAATLDTDFRDHKMSLNFEILSITNKYLYLSAKILCDFKNDWEQKFDLNWPQVRLNDIINLKVAIIIFPTRWPGRFGPSYVHPDMRWWQNIDKNDDKMVTYSNQGHFWLKCWQRFWIWRHQLQEKRIHIA